MELRWIPCSSGNVPGHAVIGGSEYCGAPLYIARAPIRESNYTPGKLSPVQQSAYVSYAGKEHALDRYEVLINPGRISLQWVPLSAASSPPRGAVAGGSDKDGDTLYVGRTRRPDGMYVPGKISYRHGCCYIAYDGNEESDKDKSDILVAS